MTTADTFDAADSESGLEADQAPAFSELGVPQPLVRLLAAEGKKTAFPIQADTLPDSLAGRDILGRGQTGSGKTLAYSLPLVARLAGESPSAAAMKDFERIQAQGGSHSRSKAMLPHPRALVLAPTRELVNQIDEVITPLAKAYDMTTVTVYGGVKQGRQVSRLRSGADIVIACPGRLEDLLRQRMLSLESVEISVLDEADEMADMGFLPSVQRLLEQVAPEGQHMLFSATLDHGVDKVVRQFLNDAKVHAVDSAESHVDTMTHHVFSVSQGNKYEVIRELASGKGKRILFTRTKYQAQKMAKKLVDAGIPAVDLQGNLSQNQRDRHLGAFTDGQVRVLVATDVAARGIDVSDVTLVVQTEPPEDSKSFLHRSGRTARAGETGDVVTLVLPNQQRGARSMMRQAGIKVKAEEVVPGSPILKELVGEHAPLVKGWTLTVPVVNSKAGRGHGGQNRGRGGSRSEGRGRFSREDRNFHSGGSSRGRDGRGRSSGGDFARGDSYAEGRSDRDGSRSGKRGYQGRRSDDRHTGRSFDSNDRTDHAGQSRRHQSGRSDDRFQSSADSRDRRSSRRNRDSYESRGSYGSPDDRGSRDSYESNDSHNSHASHGGRSDYYDKGGRGGRGKRNYGGVQSGRRTGGFRHSGSKKKSAPFRVGR
ncbi:DNA helicase [Bifidobacterium aemilianum]|uniref:DNA helicase n=1 Tax=Bifidobacterium aemilianum TaxID=2493120 RepID=A0A366K8C5_9BIFI|nr:DEAD/DEAH box helicase [Bifidobacterium aemilianum]RBP97373.1 DNA helicase [Bifidobacterium aemilianum]